MQKKIIILLFLLIPISVSAQFLIRGGVRNAALGGTGISSSNDLSSAIWNPALLGEIGRIELLTDRRQYFWKLDNDNLAFNFASIGYPFGAFGTIALSGSFFNSLNYNESKIGLHYGKSLFNKKLSLGLSFYNYNKSFEHNTYTQTDPFFEQFGYKINNFD